MLTASWLGKIAAGQIETEMADLVITDGCGNRFEGQGLLKWTKEDGVRIDAMTEGADGLLKRFGQAPCAIGQIIPNEHYLRLEGKTRNGEIVKVGRILPQGNDYSVNLGHPTVVWKIPQSSVYSDVSIVGTSDSEVTYTELLLTPVDIRWPRASETLYENRHFAVASSAFDWLEFTFSAGQIAAQKIEDRLARVRINHRVGSGKARIPVSLAFGFLTGRTVNVLAEEVRCDRSVTRTIFRLGRVAGGNRFSSPVSDAATGEHTEQLLAKATDFFCTDVGEQAANLLHMCHASVSSTFTIRALVVCVVLESLVKLLAPAESSQPTISDGQKEDILVKLRWLGLGERVCNRFSAFIGRMDEVGPKNRLHEWAADGILGITLDDVNAWNGLRNRAAHGRLLMDGKEQPERQSRIDDLRRVENLVVKLLLNAMDYEGRYYDHVEYQMKSFTSVAFGPSHRTP